MSGQILVIDDDPAVLRAYGRLLARLGRPVRLLGDIEEARSAAAILRGVDVLVLDQRMPGMTGLDLLTLLLRDLRPGERRPAVLLITAVLTEDLRARAESLGVVDVLEKPVAPDLLIARVGAALRRGVVMGAAEVY